MVTEVASRDMLRALFPVIDRGMREIARRNGEARWIGADIYAMVFDGSLKMAVIESEDGEELYGWFTWFIDDDGRTYPDLNAFMVYILPKAPRRAVAEVDNHLTKEAEAAGAKTVRFDTVRRGWARRLAPMGYDTETITLTKRVGP